MMRRIRAGCLLTLVAGGVLAGVWMGRKHCAGGSSITNPNAFASGQIAAGLRAAGR